MRSNSKILTNNFIIYGLNRKRNILCAPICECGCGQKMYVELEDKDDVIEFCSSVLSEVECDAPAIFCVFQDGTYMTVAKVYDDDGDEQIAIGESDDVHFFAEMDGEYRFCSYGLITEIRPGEWEVNE